uniref:Uncharacterized protein n=1 Tax=Caenorhabditis japonica TaxID=281687 RepID=A0A8R1ISB0_CAEJA
MERTLTHQFFSPKPHKETNEITVTDTAAVTVSTVCEAIVCSFNESEPCSNMASQSDWFLSSEPVGNLLTGVRGDASSLPFNADGSFAYVSGPLMKSRLQTPSFSVDKAVTVVFSYYKADKTSRFQAIVKEEGSEEKAMFGKAVLDPLVGRLLSDSYICFYEEMSTSSPSATSQFFSTLKNRMN